MAGFSWRNLFNMSEFYSAYRDSPELQPLVATIAWTHNLIIVQRCADPLEREFYIRMTVSYGWTKDFPTYRTVKRLPKELDGQLPAPEEIIKLLEGAS